METSGSLQDHSQVHGESEDLDHGETDFHKQDQEAELYSQEQDERGKSSSSSSSSSGKVMISLNKSILKYAQTVTISPRAPSLSASQQPATFLHWGSKDSHHPTFKLCPDQTCSECPLTQETEPGRAILSEAGERESHQLSRVRVKPSSLSCSQGEVEPSRLRRLNIKKDDEFFHFVLLCFAIGALLVCYHYYTDWFMSLGVGLLTFASLETIGIYFGLVYRIHSVLHGFVPLLQKFRLIGFRKTD
eukprot:XP_028334621.1 transmembrane protein 40 [Physeter catodon]